MASSTPPGTRRRLPRVVAPFVAAAAALALAAAGGVAIALPPASTALADAPRGPLTVAPAARGNYRVGDVTVTLDDRLRVTSTHAHDPVWQTPAGAAFVTAGVGTASWTDRVGMVRVASQLTRAWPRQSVQSVSVAGDAITFAGRLTATYDGYTSVAIPLTGDVARDAELVAADPLGASVQDIAMRAPGWVPTGPGADAMMQLGPDVVLAPVLRAGATSVQATLPPGRWRQIRTGGVYGDPARATTATVAAPLGRSALFVREGTAVAGELAQFVARAEAS